LEAAGLHDFAHEIRGHLHEPRTSRSLRRVAPRREPERRGPRPEGDERIMRLTERTEEFQGMLHGLREQVGNIEAISRATDEAHRGLDEIRHHLEERMQQFERAIHEVSEGTNQHVNHLEKSVGERFEHVERHFTKRLEEVEEFLKDLDERLRDDDDDDDDDE
jgi:DNA anti-recombination protein RmuC